MSSRSSRRSGRAQRARRARAARPAEQPREQEFSAGGVLVRGEEIAAIVPVRRAADGSKVLALPKGHVDGEESAIEAAAREVREETGLSGEPLCELGESRYWYRRDGRTIGKTVKFFLFRHTGGDTAEHDDEVEEVRWIGLREAVSELSHAAEREIAGLALAYLDKDR
jgi:8-oxo-dGTP pyrophosphatase MutT (NUDIX family)